MIARIGAVAMIAMGTVALAAPAAYAADGVKVSVRDLDTFSPGDTQALAVQVTNNGPKTDLVAVTVRGLQDFTVGSASGCDTGAGGNCSVTLEAGKSANVSFQIKAPASVPAGKTQTEHGTVKALGFSGPDSADFTATVKGGAAPPSQAAGVASVSGVVRDQDSGEGLANARVMLVDSGQCQPGRCQTGTDSKGNFKFPVSGIPIAPGSLTIGAIKSQYGQGSVTVNGAAGQSVTGVAIKLKTAVSASQDPSTDAVPSFPTGPTDGGAAPTAANAGAPQAASESGPSTTSWVILVLAGLLVMAGVGVFVVMFINRRKNKGGGPGDDNRPHSGPPGGGPPPGGYGGGADPTMVGAPTMNHAGMGIPGSNAQTAIIPPQRPEDEFPDPYAAPYPANPGYGQGGYGNGYTPQQPAGYEAGTQVYGQQPAGGYEAGTQVYGQQPVSGGYGQQHDPYAQQPGDYAAPPAPRYDESTRHWDGGGYPGGGQPPQPAGYGQQHDPYAQQPPQAQPGYAPEQRGGYDPYQQQPQEPTHRGAPQGGQGGDRQRLDWLDN